MNAEALAALLALLPQPGVREAMVEIFDKLGQEHALVIEYRTKLAAALYK
jgi:thioredoxin-like negative regulator of GroEL